MDSYKHFENEKVKWGTLSSACITKPHLREIAESICGEEGGVSVIFKKLEDGDFDALTSCFDNPAKPGAESYIVRIADTITIYYTAEITKIYALYAIKRNYSRSGISKGIIYNTPKSEFRCFRSYLPGKKTLQEFKRTIDMFLAFGNNTLMLEIGGAMEYKSHPEISEGWVEYCKIFEEYNGKTEHVQRSSHFPKNCIHPDNGEGEYLTYEELGEIVDYCRERHMEIIPEVPSLCHVDYILYNHPEMAENMDDHLHNNACPQNEEYQQLIRDILDEIVEVFKPKRINICHDEAYVFGQCPRCKGQNAAKLFADDITRMHDHLAKKGVKTMIWGDGILPVWHGGDEQYHHRLPWDGKSIVTINNIKHPIRFWHTHSKAEWEEIKKNDPDAEAWYTPATRDSIDMVPKDLQVMNWSWSLDHHAEELLIEKGLYNVYGNFNAGYMKNYDKNMAAGVKGFSHSNWGRTDFEALQRTGSLFALAFNSLADWSYDYDDSKARDNSYTCCEAVYRYMNYDALMTKHLEITHTTDNIIHHDSFIDGYVIHREDFRMGDYEITYTDGTFDTFPIYWGYNIGRSDIPIDPDATIARHIALDYTPTYTTEPVGVTKAQYDGKRAWFTIAIPITKDVAKVTPKLRSGYNVEVKQTVVVDD